MSTEKTKKILEKIIEKPRITVALLERPPFKFIVDIVANVIETTGFLKTDFSTEDFENSGKSKESKVQFLEKLIKILDTDGSLRHVKASKIVSGQDAEETNRMLQKLGTDAKYFQSENGEKKEKKTKKSKSEKNPDEKKKKKKEKESEETPKKKRSRSETKEPEDVTKKHKERRHKSSDKKSKKTLEKQDSKSEKILIRQDSVDIHHSDPESPSPRKDDNDDEGFGDDPVDQKFDLPPKVEEPVKLIDMPPLIRPTTGAAGGRPMTSMGRPGTASSRPAPPKLKKKQIATIDNTPQVAIELKSEILTDSMPKLDFGESDENFIMENEEDSDRTVRLSDFVETEEGAEHRGALVQKIMETKAGIEEGGGGGHLEEDSGDSGGIAVEREKTKRLREQLQDLTRSAYPLARMFDFVNDDIESMVREMERWRTEQRKSEQEEQNRRAAGYGDSSRLYTIIDNLHAEIRELKEELGRAKGRVVHNEKKIQALISNF